MTSKALLLSIGISLLCVPAMAKNILQATAVHSGTLKINEKLVSPHGKFRLVMQSDGNLVVYPKSITPGCPTPDCSVWNSKTNGRQATFPGKYHASIQGDGHLVVYSAAKGIGGVQLTPIYVSNPSLPTGSYFLSMQDDGNLVIYQGTPQTIGAAMWSSKAGKLY